MAHHGRAWVVLQEDEPQVREVAHGGIQSSSSLRILWVFRVLLPRKAEVDLQGAGRGAALGLLLCCRVCTSGGAGLQGTGWGGAGQL